MNKSAVNFNQNQLPEFYKTLRQRVNAHFKERGIPTTANANMKFKTLFMIALYSAPLFLMLSGLITSLWVMLLMWVIMGFGMSGIGLSIMHDANHGSYSTNKHVNNALGFILNYIGGYHHNWKIQHNVLHHTYTNIDGYDDDIDKEGIVRFSPTQEHKWFYRYQLFYVPFLYSIMTLYWLVFKDIQQTVRYGRLDLLSTQGLTPIKAFSQIIIYKLVYVAFTLVLPIYIMDFPWWQVLIGFLIMQAICGLILAFIFQSAHVIQETQFFKVDETGSVENSWAIHQLYTTANFANGSRFFSWFVGALNYQIEHHLFPNVCHVHYREIAPIVKQTAEEFGLPYYHHPTFWGALKSHFSLLHSLGTGAYDRKMQAAA
jgi:linoleoyl-CoA desaturase